MSFQSAAPPFPYIKSTHSLVAKHVTPEKWAKLGGLKTKTSGFTLSQVRYFIALRLIGNSQFAVKKHPSYSTCVPMCTLHSMKINIILNDEMSALLA